MCVVHEYQRLGICAALLFSVVRESFFSADFFGGARFAMEVGKCIMLQMRASISHRGVCDNC